MRWVKVTSIALAVLIIVTGTLIFVSYNLDNRVAETSERGYDQGHSQGYLAGYQEGIRTGYQDGGELGYLQGSKIGYKEGEEESYNYGYTTGFEEGVGTDDIVRKPTYDELQEFLAEDDTSSAWEINNNAEDKGIQTAYVRIRIATWYPPPLVATKVGDEGLIRTPPLSRADWSPYYYWVAFDTADKGLVFVQPWSGNEVELEVGKCYSELNGFQVPEYDDTIVEILVIW